jgi:hypothetical protein
MVVEARIFNDMKSHLDEIEFWAAIAHLHTVGLSKGKITAKMPPPEKWQIKRPFGKI